jgi:hypothetical protein
MSADRALLPKRKAAGLGKANLVLCLLALLPLLVLIVLWPGGNDRTPWARAAHVDTTFGPIVNVSNSVDQTGSQHPRAVLAPDGQLHVAWMDGILDPDHNFGPAYTKGRDTWDPYEWAAPHNNAGYTNPGIALDSAGTVHLVWAVGTVPSGYGYTSPYEIYYTTKPAGGSWTTPENLSNESYNTVLPSIAIDSQDRLWVAWQASTANGDEIYVRTKAAGGAWEPVVNLSNNGAKNQNPCLILDVYGTPHVVWRSTAPGNWEVFYSKYQGGSWTPPGNLSSTSKPSYFPRLATDASGNLYLVWEEDRGNDNFQIEFRRWDGSQWLAAKDISPSGGKALYPSIAAENGNLYVVWQDYRTNPGYPEIFFSYSTDSGTTWHANENVSQNPTSSYWPDVVAQAGGMAHIFWENMGSTILEIYYRLGTTGAPPPTTVIPTPVSPTPDPHPYGSVDIVAQQPPGSVNYTRQLNVNLDTQATSPIGANLMMRYSNYDSFGDGPGWVGYSSSVADWSLLGPTNNCATKQVFAQYKDDQGNESPVYTDHILFDDYVATAMQLNGGKSYTNRALVMVNSSEEPAGCSGLTQMALSGNGITFTNAMPFFSQAYYLPSPAGQTDITVYTRYTDTAGNTATLSDDILFDRTPPSGTPPTLPGSTIHLVVPATNLSASDTPSGVANVWFANRPNGPWWVTPYIAGYTYNWNLAYGGPPIQVPSTHAVYVRYEDNSGYGAFSGNLSPAYSTTISVSGISSTYLPLTARRYTYLGAVPGPVENPEVGLVLLSEPQQAGPGQQVLIWLFAQREQPTPLEGTLRVTLPEGLRVIGAWSAYGHSLQFGDRVVVSRERVWDQQAPFILIQARVEGETGCALQVQGDMTWDQGTATAVPVLIENQ